MKTYEIKVYGRVQGVNFRYNVKRFCEINNINGIVMNKEDGSVLIIAQCEKENLRNFSLWLKSNPGLSRVDKLSIEEQQISKRYTNFQIARKETILKDQKRSFKNLARSLREV